MGATLPPFENPSPTPARQSIRHGGTFGGKTLCKPQEIVCKTLLPSLPKPALFSDFSEKRPIKPFFPFSSLFSVFAPFFRNSLTFNHNSLTIFSYLCHRTP